jgi:LmbE family N-acetylglucosaminyl deacetylase
VAAPVVVISPHLDDAVLGAWSVLRRPGAVRVVNVCTAIPPEGPAPPWDRLTGAADAAERMRERLAEDRVALAHARRKAVSLDFLDAQYRSGPLDLDELARSLSEAAPEASELWAPAGIGAHADHTQVRDAALSLIAAGGPPVHLYADLPYATRYGWPEWVSGQPDESGLDLDSWWAAFLPEGVAFPGERHELTPAEEQRKLRALVAYATQWRALDMGRRILSGNSILRYEASFPAPAVPAPGLPQ